MSNGCSIYCGSKGINNSTEEDLTSILKEVSFDENNKKLEDIIKEYAHSDFTPEKILDKLYQINNFYNNKKISNNIIKKLCFRNKL